MPETGEKKQETWTVKTQQTRYSDSVRASERSLWYYNTSAFHCGQSQISSLVQHRSVLCTGCNSVWGFPWQHDPHIWSNGLHIWHLLSATWVIKFTPWTELYQCIFKFDIKIFEWYSGLMRNVKGVEIMCMLVQKFRVLIWCERMWEVRHTLEQLPMTG